MPPGVLDSFMMGQCNLRKPGYVKASPQIPNESFFGCANYRLGYKRWVNLFCRCRPLMPDHSCNLKRDVLVFRVPCLLTIPIISTKWILGLVRSRKMLRPLQASKQTNYPRSSTGGLAFGFAVWRVHAGLLASGLSENKEESHWKVRETPTFNAKFEYGYGTGCMIDLT